MSNCLSSQLSQLLLNLESIRFHTSSSLMHALHLFLAGSELDTGFSPQDASAQRSALTSVGATFHGHPHTPAAILYLPRRVCITDPSIYRTPDGSVDNVEDPDRLHELFGIVIISADIASIRCTGCSGPHHGYYLPF